MASGRHDEYEVDDDHYNLCPRWRAELTQDSHYEVLITKLTALEG